MAGAIAPEDLERHVRRLAGEIGERHVLRPRALQAAADYIAGEWRGQGYADVAEQAYDVRGVRCANLEVERRGAARPGEVLLVGAHYDTVPGCPGANDNGSGVAALLEISRLFAALAPAVTVRFVAFVNEEPPFFTTGEQGSMIYARAARAFRAGSDFPLQHAATLRSVPGVAWSDHRSFWREGYRALMVTDTAFYRYPYYHTPLDTPDRLNYPAFARATDGLGRAFAALAADGP